jgi:hypothetical protein
MPFVSPYRFTNMDELLKERLGKPEVSSEGNPKKFIDKSDPRYQESIYAEPDVVPSMDPGNLGGTVAKVGGGIKETLGKIVAGPWRSRTLETIEKNPKMPSSASPQTWLSKLRGAGLPKDETMVAEKFLGQASPGGKLSREQVSGALSTKLPELGVTKTTLGGAEWEAGQKRLDEIAPQSRDLTAKLQRMRETGEYTSEEFDATRQQAEKLFREQQELLGSVSGKRPRWSGDTFNIPGLRNYQEEYTHAPLKDGGTYRNADMETHFPDRPDNLHTIRTGGELDLPDGKTSAHMSLLQNDHAAAFDKQQQVKSIIKKAPEQAERLQDFVRREVPEPIMLNTWWKNGIKRWIQDAVKQGNDFITTDTVETQIARNAGGDEKTAGYMKNHYGNNIPGFLKKEYGVTPVEKYTKNTMVADIPVLKSQWNPDVKSVKIDPDFVSVDSIPGKDGYYLRVPDQHSDVGAGYKVDNRIFDTYEEGWKAREELIKGLKTYEAPDVDSKKVLQWPVTDKMKKDVEDGMFFSKAAKPGGNHAESVA